jgi:septum formation protein
MDLVLASTSPRRHALLREAGIPFVTANPDVEEWDAFSHPENTPTELVLANARRKAMAVWQEHQESCVLAADTLVCCEGRILGKPTDLGQAKEMLRWLSGRSHEVMTAVTWIHGRDLRESVVRTWVTFRSLDDAMIEEYLRKVHVLDKAGAYALQEHGALLVERVEGSRTNVIGLPMEKVLEWWGGMEGVRD